MTPQEHRAAAERLLAEAEVYPPLVTVEGNLSAEDAQRIKDRIAEQIGKPPMVISGRVHIDVTSTLLAALTHAVLGLEMPGSDVRPDQPLSGLSDRPSDSDARL